MSIVTVFDEEYDVWAALPPNTQWPVFRAFDQLWPTEPTEEEEMFAQIHIFIPSDFTPFTSFHAVVTFTISANIGAKKNKIESIFIDAIIVCLL